MVQCMGKSFYFPILFSLTFFKFCPYLNFFFFFFYLKLFNFLPYIKRKRKKKSKCYHIYYSLFLVPFNLLLLLLLCKLISILLFILVKIWDLLRWLWYGLGFRLPMWDICYFVALDCYFGDLISLKIIRSILFSTFSLIE